jgi:hypothetical protein
MAHVIVVSHRVVASGRAVSQVLFLDVTQSVLIELRFPDPAPVHIVGDQIKTGREGAVRADQGTIVACAAVPGLQAVTHSQLEIPQVRDRIDPGPTSVLLLNQPVQKPVYFLPFLFRDAQQAPRTLGGETEAPPWMAKMQPRYAEPYIDYSDSQVLPSDNGLCVDPKYPETLRS